MVLLRISITITGPFPLMRPSCRSREALVSMAASPKNATMALTIKGNDLSND
jgi:hypothetical protein